MIHSLEDLRSSVALACQPTGSTSIMKGRSQVYDLPREWVLENIEHAAFSILDLSDYWEFRRLLELLQPLDSEILQRFVSIGLAHTDADVREAAEDFERPDPE